MNEPQTLIVEDRRVGTGESVHIGSRVVIHCVVWQINHYCVSEENKEFVVEEGGEVAGLVEGMKDMRVGGKRVIRGPTRWWYGEDAAPNGIPSNVGLEFEVELLKAS